MTNWAILHNFQRSEEIYDWVTWVGPPKTWRLMWLFSSVPPWHKLMISVSPTLDVLNLHLWAVSASTRTHKPCENLHVRLKLFFYLLILSSVISCLLLGCCILTPDVRDRCPTGESPLALPHGLLSVLHPLIPLHTAASWSSCHVVSFCNLLRFCWFGLSGSFLCFEPKLSVFWLLTFSFSINRCETKTNWSFFLYQRAEALLFRSVLISKKQIYRPHS